MHLFHGLPPPACVLYSRNTKERGEEVEDKQLVELLQKKSGDAAQALMSKYGPMIHYIINPIVENRQDREECYSDVILRVLDKVGQFQGPPEKFKAWLTAVTRNVAKNKVRGKKIWHESEEAWQHIPSKEPTPEEEILQKEMEKQLRDILTTSLKKQEQELIYRRFYYEQSLSQIAGELGITERAAEGKLYRIRKKLEKILRKRMQEG